MVRDTPLERKKYRRQLIARVRSKDPAAAAVATARMDREQWDGRDREAAVALIKQAAKDCSQCTVCAAAMAPGQSATLRRHDIGKYHPFWVWAPVCLSCTLTRVRKRPWPWSDNDHPRYDGFRRFRCRACRRPLRVSRTSQVVMSPTCCEVCQRLDRLQRNADRRRVKHEPMTCVECGETFIPKRADAVTCSNKCRQAQHRKKHAIA
jgi:hypothetical protein